MTSDPYKLGWLTLGWLGLTACPVDPQGDGAEGSSGGTSTGSAAASSSGETPDASTTSSSTAGVDSTDGSADACAPSQGTPYDVRFDAPDAGKPGLGGTVDEHCSTLSSSTARNGRFNCGPEGMVSVRVDLDGVDLTALPDAVRLIGPVPAFEGGGGGAVIITGRDAGEMLFFSLAWPVAWSTPDGWESALAPLDFQYLGSDCEPYVPAGDPNATCVRGSMRIAGPGGEVEIGSSPTAALGEYRVFVASVATCEVESMPPPNLLRFLVLHESLLP